jgi:hypothetical protein
MQLGRHINKKNYPEIKRWMSEQQQASVQNQNKAAYMPSQVIEGNNSYPVDDIESYFTPYKEE